jgi:peroxiredoxin
MELREGNTLRRAEGFLQEGKKGEARQLLVSYVKRIPDSADAWWLLSQAVEDKAQRKDCLKRVLRFEPNHILALTHLDLLENPPVSIKKPQPISPFQKKDLPPVTHEPSIETSPSQTLTAAYAPAPQENASNTAARKQNKKTSRAKKTKQKPNKGLVALIIFLMLLGLIGIMYFGYLIYTGINQTNSSLAPQHSAGETPAQALSLPPTWTFTPSPIPPPTHTPYPTTKPTRTPPPIATYTKLPRIVGVSVGQYAPDFTLKNPESNSVSLSDYTGKPIVMIFWATWCPYCEQEIPALKTVYQNYHQQGLVVLAINTGDSASQVKKYQSEHNITYPILLDSNKKISTQYRVSGVPFYYLINANGKIIYAASGMFGQAALENNVRVLMTDVSQ